MEAFERMRVNYTNVSRVHFDDLTKQGDYGVLRNWL